MNCTQLWLKLQFCWISTQGPLRQCSMCWPSRTNNHVHERLAWRETLTQKYSGAHRHLLPLDNWLNDPIAKPAAAFMSFHVYFQVARASTDIYRHPSLWNFSVAMRSGLHVRLPTWVIHELIGETAEQWLPKFKALPQRSTEIVLLKLGLQQQTKKKVNLKYPLASNPVKYPLASNPGRCRANTSSNLPCVQVSFINLGRCVRLLVHVCHLLFSKIEGTEHIGIPQVITSSTAHGPTGGCFFGGGWSMLKWSPHTQLQDVVLCGKVQCNCSCTGSCSCGVVAVVVAAVVVLEV